VNSIGISKDQQRRMDSIFDANRTALEENYKQLKTRQATLRALSKAPQVDQTKLFAAIDSVSEARAGLEKAYTQMLLQIRQQMTPDQVGRLQNLP
jgi:Spy/CpxP family protein refolding chaperone